MNDNQLSHVTVGDQNGGPFVLVLQDGAQITAEDRAMLQALYSRSPASVISHLEKLKVAGSGKFMEMFYVGYGHKSIGDCGDTTIFIENVSMLVAKAVQDWALYNGQEVSTRYIDFTTQPFVNSLALPENNPQDWLRSFYVETLPLLKEDLKKHFPMNEDEKEVVYDKAIAARAFDILRGFLPAGAKTSLAWTTNLRQAADKLAYLRSHPLKEVRDIAVMIDEALKQAHPHSFNHKMYPASEEYRTHYMNTQYYFNPEALENKVRLTRNSVDENMRLQYSDSIANRPDKTELPKALAEIGTLQFEFTLDFGSFRDLARQRAVIQRMPLLTTRFGFHDWYYKQLEVGEGLKERAQELISKIEVWWKDQVALGVDQQELQYYVPMGFRVPCRITGDIPALVYLVELRSGVTVHATLREVSQYMGEYIEKLGFKLYLDRSDSGRFDVKRGAQDITAKPFMV